VNRDAPGADAETPLLAARVFATFCLALLTACAGVKEASSASMAQPAPPTAAASAAARMGYSPVAPEIFPSGAILHVAASEPPVIIEDWADVKRTEPPLDVAELKARLRDTNAIGVFTKLALKNQVDDLMQQFRTHYLAGPKTSVAALRQPFDMLILKVLALIQDDDPSLARTISGSREAIWGILADPVKFDSAS
jgi:hypothetical protein